MVLEIKKKQQENADIFSVVHVPNLQSAFISLLEMTYFITCTQGPEHQRRRPSALESQRIACESLKSVTQLIPAILGPKLVPNECCT